MPFALDALEIQSMPNGRSGGFPLQLAHFQQLLATAPSDAIVGSVISWPLVGKTATEISSLVDDATLDPIPVEQQAETGYILHLCNSPESVWLGVRPDSPIFVELRNRHQQWMREHPGYLEWIGF